MLSFLLSFTPLFVLWFAKLAADVTFDQLCLECPSEAGGGVEERSSSFRQGKK